MAKKTSKTAKSNELDGKEFFAAKIGRAHV